jgi:hypothetical protein
VTPELSGGRPVDILDKIDDVITWHGSPDAMVWNADPPTWPDVPRARIDSEAARRVFQGLARHVEAMTMVLRPIAEQMQRSAQALQALRPILALTTPEPADPHSLARLSRMKREYRRRAARR